MSEDGRAVANYVLDVCQQGGRRVTNLSLQKIVYFCHVWSLIRLGRPLVKQQFEAWQYGPVLQYLYREFKAFDDAPITTRATGLDPHTGTRKVIPYEFDATTERVLREVVNFYSRLTAGQLVSLSHVDGGPWHEVWNHAGRVNPGMKIDNERIASFYGEFRAPFSIQ